MAEPNEYRCGFCDLSKIRMPTGKRAFKMVPAKRPCDRCTLPVIISIISKEQRTPK